MCGICSLCRERECCLRGRGCTEIFRKAVFPSGGCDVLGSMLLLVGGPLEPVQSCSVEQNSPLSRMTGESPLTKPVTARIIFGQYWFMKNAGLAIFGRPVHFLRGSHLGSMRSLRSHSPECPGCHRGWGPGALAMEVVLSIGMALLCRNQVVKLFKRHCTSQCFGFWRPILVKRKKQVTWKDQICQVWGYFFVWCFVFVLCLKLRTQISIAQHLWPALSQRASHINFCDGPVLSSLPRETCLGQLSSQRFH